MKPVNHISIHSLILALCFFMPIASKAQTYPDRAITWIIPFPPGGTTDVVARIIANGLSQELGQPVAVENKAGAGGIIGTQQLVRARPDGYTIAMATVSTHAVSAACNPKLSYNPLTDFTPITNLVRTANVLTINRDFPAKNYSEFLDVVKASPNQYSYASSGHCGGMHMMGELFKAAANVSLLHIPYRGSGPALNDVASGQVPVMFDNLPSSIGHIKSGHIRALAVASPERLAYLPDVPTFAELGLPEVNDPAWYGVVAPMNTPKEVVQRLDKAFAAVLADEDVIKRLASSGAVPANSSPEIFTQEIKAELEKMKKVAAEQKITFEH
ncbi:tripartite tricarboxylate transporter substrate binding protein BugE [Lampropedia puyangensis]|uniref:Tripartite tricarboxylate transporter substrate binding protein BugE n=1 Tax=Lampropedia puyangensis TaxID=1330072 RepID=A0A4V4GQP0_9BURK|nr:tripartite tricarboxylate transporter substrate binding protein BugE [Lampropedia puyangensis]THT99025.1 tripartite tricarboxylate transporter substrate binding protein BugE [Lampropedia puyangensis]